MLAITRSKGAGQFNKLPKTRSEWLGFIGGTILFLGGGAVMLIPIATASLSLKAFTIFAIGAAANIGAVKIFLLTADQYERRKEQFFRNEPLFRAITMVPPEFEALFKEWEELLETMMYASDLYFVNSQLFVKTVAIGMPIVPFILLKFHQGEGACWMIFALVEITKENPVDVKHRAYHRAAMNDWIAWGERKGILPAK